MKLDTSYDFSADMGSLISEGQLKAVTDHVEDAREKGATVVAGGKARPDIGPLLPDNAEVAGEMTRTQSCCDTSHRARDHSAAVRGPQGVAGLGCRPA